MVKAQIILYCNRLIKVGGIETFTQNFVRAFKNTYDIAVVVEEEIDEIQERELLKVVPVYMRRDGEDFECDTVICNNLWPEKIPESIKYKRKIQMLHTAKMNPNWEIPECDMLVSVSQHAVDTFEYAKDVEVIHNITSTEKPRKVLRLITLSRLSEEKGLGRMIQLAGYFKKKDIPFVWSVYTNCKDDVRKRLEAADITCMGPTYDGRKFIPGNDYLVQLSDDEGYCYSIVEALELKVPVITTPIATLEEIGFIDGEHGHIIPFDISGECVEKIYKNVPKVVFKSKTAEIKKKWASVLNLEPMKTEHKCIEAVCVQRFTDIYKNRVIEVGEVFPVMKNRFEYLKERGFVEEKK